MDRDAFTAFLDGVQDRLVKDLEETIKTIKVWVADNLMDLETHQTERLMRTIRTIERVRDQQVNLDTGPVDLNKATWKVRILSCGLAMPHHQFTTERLREWALENISFSEGELVLASYGNERVPRWWHKMRPSLTTLVKEDLLERVKHGVYRVTEEGEEYWRTSTSNL